MKTVCLVIIINASVTVAATALDLPTPKPPRQYRQAGARRASRRERLEMVDR